MAKAPKRETAAAAEREEIVGEGRTGAGAMPGRTGEAVEAMALKSWKRQDLWATSVCYTPESVRKQDHPTQRTRSRVHW